ncbi:hypothetical protein M409DRAFT_36395 [Zasmidium cellare ATCC 36951]|uniref:Cercosporin MFS transporter CTB4 n=1 Tax=Zasmidium cellare ATCC 36951 TaxID=1080233 RepID=A0A6A6CPH5_ZASCE|nr:uncharacterized protein M409DRAFT_36395 [Zasmidium cellare ATCC 36951]KAF2168573.1 hypothetical protein M409DRAFT_36395 [Zasmidium cellare ATCC 36951]
MNDTTLSLGSEIRDPEISPEHSRDPEKAHLSNSNIVDWDGPDDPENPVNLPLARKWIITISLSLTNFTTTFASSIFSTANGQTAELFHVSGEVMVLGTSLYLAGFIFGPFIFGPFSELYGRKRPLFFGFIIFAIFQIPVAVAQNIQTVMICRFFQGVFGSAAQAVTGGALADIWNAEQRGFAVPVFAGSLFGGPIFGPIIGSFIVQSKLGWRWTQWITMIMAATFGIFAFITIPETYSPVLLAQRAKRLRHKTRNWALHSLSEEREISLKDIGTRYLFRPAQMLVQEPILFLVTIYMGFVFGIIYLNFEAFPISYSEHRHWSAGVSSLPFIAVLLGALAGCLLVALTTKSKLAPDPAQGRYQEARMPLMALGGFGLMIGLFWFAWTSFPSISPWPQILAGAPIGFGIMLITLQGMNYVIDCYAMYANSALAANTSIRYCLAAGFPLFANGMFHNLGVPWATSVLGFIALALLPVPLLFWKYGEKIRSMSKFVMT